MNSKRKSSKTFLTEAFLEFPDDEIAPLTRVLQGASRRGAIARDAAENWPMVKGPVPKAPVTPAVPKAIAKPTVKPTVKPATALSQTGTSSKPAATISKSGRSFPSTNRFVSGDKSADSKSIAAKKKEPQSDKNAGPGLMKKAFSAITGRDPENGLPIPKPAAKKLRGKPGKSLPDLGQFFQSYGKSTDSNNDDDLDDPLKDYPNKSPEPVKDFDDEEKTDPEYVSPFAHMPELSSDEDDEDEDEKVATVKKGFSAAAPKAGKSFSDSEKAWASFGKNSGKDDDDNVPKKKQGRLSKLFKGRRDDDI